jgi:hypothetical protein
VTNETNPIVQAAQILDRLFTLPGRRELSVETRRYPRFLPAESGIGFEQKVCSFGDAQKPANLSHAIPVDAEEVLFTWKSTMGSDDLTRQISTMVGDAFSDLAIVRGWDYQVFLRKPQRDASHIVVRVFQSFSPRSQS